MLSINIITLKFEGDYEIKIGFLKQNLKPAASLRIQISNHTNTSNEFYEHVTKY